MRESDRVKLLGSYSPPLVEFGDFVECSIRGEVEVVKLSAGPIQWPVGRYPPNGRARFLIVMGDLVEAIRRESAEAIRHWWGVGASTVWTWRLALGVGQYTEGTIRRKSEGGHSEAVLAVLAKAHEQSRDPERDGERREKIATSKMGKARPPEVGQAVGRSRKGRRHSAEVRQRMSEAHKRRGDGGADTGRPWTSEEDTIVQTMDAQEAARRTGRTVKAVWARRRKLGVNRVE
jgi:hypothetical protein